MVTRGVDDATGGVWMVARGVDGGSGSIAE